MKNKILLSCFTAGLIFSGVTIAGGHVSHAGMPNGFFAGVGAADNSVAFSHPSWFYVNGNLHPTSTGQVNLFSPVGQIGWFSRAMTVGSHHVSWGAKFVYSYLRAHSFDFGATSNDIISKANHQLSLLLQLNMALSHRLSSYVAAGGALFPNVVNTMSSGGTSISTLGHDLWGGIGQLGLVYRCCNNVFLDMSYSYAVTGEKSYDETVGGNDYLRNLQVVSQSVMLTANYTLPV